MATKQVLLQSGDFGGDGGTVYDLALGRDTPQMVLYTDGQFLIKGNPDWYLETTLSTAEMCSLLHKIASTGFFQVNGTGALKEQDPIYKFDASAQFSDGGLDHVIQVNGNPAKYVNIYREYEAYVVNPLKAVLRALDTYRPSGLKPYKPDRLLLWVEAGRGVQEVQPGVGDEPTATPQVRTWPVNLPPLADLLGAGPVNQLYIQGGLVEPLLNLPMPYAYGIFTDRGKDYSVIVRPLLPHETIDNYSSFPNGVTQFDLPFKCGA